MVSRKASYDHCAKLAVKLAASAMTETVLPPDILKGLKPEHIAPFVGILTAKNVSNRFRGLDELMHDIIQGPDVTGRTFELAAGFYSEIRWERSKGNCEIGLACTVD